MDNRYHNYGCPPLMNDGRFISNYIRSSTYDQYIRNMNNIESANDYRHYLQNNSDVILNRMKGYLRQNNTCAIEGRCLSMNNDKINASDPNTGKWYEEIMDNSSQDSNLMIFNDISASHSNISNNTVSK